MRVFPKACIVIIALCFPTTVLAQFQEGIRCVQEQLTAAGFDPGPSNGRLRSKTRQALTAYQEEHGKLSSRKLDDNLGNAYCRLIGLQQPSLQEYWPSRPDNRPVVVFSKSISDDVIAQINSSIDRVYDRFDELLGLELAGRDVIVVGSREHELKSLISRHSKLSGRRSPPGIRGACASKREASGGYAPGVLYVCVNSGRGAGPINDQQWFEYSMAYSVMWLAQRQLGGSVAHSRGQKAILEAHGPIWLSAGVAGAFGSRVAGNWPDWRFREASYQRLEKRFPDLAKLEFERTFRQRRIDVEHAGTIAAIDLVDLFGYPAIGEFYSHLGTGIGWKASFKRAFGITVDEFYTHYKFVNRFDAYGNAIRGPLNKLHRQ